MTKATFNGKVIAESDNCIELENNMYFPVEDVNMEYLRHSETETSCPWKGVASYYDVEVDGKVSKDAAWQYKDPKEEAENIKEYIAFWKDVEVV